jgi:regulator of protease activity HflC (stomatin/prohibitin superfamily)
MTPTLLLGAVFVLGIVLFAMGVARTSIVVVERGTARLVHRLGRFHRVAGAGLNLRLPLLERFGPPVDLEVQVQDVRVETHTEDGVFVEISVAVQFFAVQAQLAEAGYRISEVAPLVVRVAQECVRERVPLLRMEALEVHRRTLADALLGRIAPALALVGYETVRVAVPHIQLDASVRAAITELQASQRLHAAAIERAAAQRLLEVQAAETRAECTALEGRGIADRRHAILLGLRDSIEDLRRGTAGASLTEVMDLVVAAQLLDGVRSPASQAVERRRAIRPLDEAVPTFVGDWARPAPRAAASG